MRNKLGVSMSKLSYIEREIVNKKLNIIDEYVMFECKKFDFQYLKSLNDFLFSDFYFSEDLGTRRIEEKEKAVIDKCLSIIEEECLSNKDVKKILKLIQYLWHLQPFAVGNTRTFYAYLKVLNSAFLLDLDIDVNKEIISDSAIFEYENFVNQNRLTK